MVRFPDVLSCAAVARDVPPEAERVAREPDQQALPLSAYFGREDQAVAREVKILKAVSLLRETLWALIQTVASEIEFDYATYSAGLFDAYRRAREALN